MTKTKFFRVGTELVGATQSPVSNPVKRIFYHADHLGGVHVISDINGARVQLTEYDPWGKVSRSEGDVDPEKRFTGQILDPESGLYYYGARYYDPELARFISPDPIVPSPGDPQSLNRYSYVRNNPVKYIDPTGHSFWSAIGNFFKNLFRNPVAIFMTLATAFMYGPVLAGAMLFAQAIASTSQGAGIAMGFMTGGLLGALAAGVPEARGGITMFMGALMLASGNPGGAFIMVSGGLSYCRSKGCQIASAVYGVVGTVVGAYYASKAGSTGTSAEEASIDGIGGPPGNSGCPRCPLMPPSARPVGAPTLQLEGILGGGEARGTSEYVSSEYGVARPVGTSPHGGMDVVRLGLKWGQTIYSPCDCVVSGLTGGGIILRPSTGSTLPIDIYLFHEVGFKGSLALNVGDSVSFGQIIGKLAPIGTATGPNLHIEVWQGGAKFNPRAVLQ